jgi:hypothetical protein
LIRLGWPSPAIACRATTHTFVRLAQEESSSRNRTPTVAAPLDDGAALLNDFADGVGDGNIVTVHWAGELVETEVISAERYFIVTVKHGCSFGYNKLLCCARTYVSLANTPSAAEGVGIANDRAKKSKIREKKNVTRGDGGRGQRSKCLPHG